MRRFLLLLILAWSVSLSAQNNAGIVTYAEVIKTAFTPPADMDPAMKAQIEEMMKKAPKTITMFKDLTFNPDFALYKISPKQEAIDAEREVKQNMEGGGGRGGYRRMMFNANGIHFWELKKSKVVDKRIFFEKEFLIKDEAPNSNGRFLGDAKQIAGYVCQKASTKIDTTEVIAWFCPTIPASVGPNGIGQLPGLILELSPDDRTTITADTVILQAINTNDYEQPKGGKVVTKAEYDQIVKEKMDEMRAEWKSRMNGGGGPRFHAE